MKDQERKKLSKQENEITMSNIAREPESEEGERQILKELQSERDR